MKTLIQMGSRFSFGRDVFLKFCALCFLMSLCFHGLPVEKNNPDKGSITCSCSLSLSPITFLEIGKIEEKGSEDSSFFKAKILPIYLTHHLGACSGHCEVYQPTCLYKLFCSFLI